MTITLLQGIIITIAVMILAVDAATEALFIFRPIIVAPIVGLLLGDLNTGLQAGAIVELAFAGITAVGGVVPPNAILCAVMTVVLAKTNSITVSSAYVLAYPFALLQQYVNTVICTAFSAFNRPAEKYARKGNEKGLFRLCAEGLLINSLAYGVVTFLSVYALQEPIQRLVESMPQELIHGLEVAGGVIPAVGFAMLLRVMLKPRYVPYLIIGFLAATYLNISNILPVALIGLAFGLIEYYNAKDEEKGADKDGEEGI